MYVFLFLVDGLGYCFLNELTEYSKAIRNRVPDHGDSEMAEELTNLI